MTSRGGLLALLFLGCTTETTRVRDARDHFYGAISAFDQTAIRTAVAPDYISIDRGRLFNLDSLIADMTLLEQQSLPVRYAFLDSVFRVDPPMAWVVYRSRKIVTRANDAETTFAMESATFRRDGSGWRLVLLHRTPLDEAVGHFEADTTPPPPPATPPAESIPPSRRAQPPIAQPPP